MIALGVKDVKGFMNGMLAGNLFDPFLMIEGMLVVSVTYSFDGHINYDFYPEEERDNAKTYEFQPWSEFKKTALELIKGRNSPILVKFMFMLKPDKALEMLSKESPEEDFSSLKGLLVSMKYENGAITLTTGTSYDTFVPSHDTDRLWDSNIRKYFSAKGIDLDLL